MEGSKGKVEYEQIKSAFHVGDTQIIGIIIAVTIVLITLVLFAIWHRRRNARRGILLMGLCDSGKTLIFSRLLHSRFVFTHTSVKENIGDYILNSGFLKIIDIPGHERLRSKFFDQYKNIARGIVYVVDSVTFQKEIRDVAEFLYILLSDPVISSNCPPILILCNKQDQTMSKGRKVIQSQLEKEMNMLRVTKSSQLESTNETANNNTFLGKQGKDFEFSHIQPIYVTFGESSALNKDNNEPAELDDLEQWLNKIG